MIKIKVNVTYPIYKILISDMYYFKCYKPSGEINKNEFLNSIIFGMEEIEKDSLTKLKEKTKRMFDLYNLSSDADLLVNSVISNADNIYFGNNRSLRSQYYFMIYSTKKYDEFYTNLLYNKIGNDISISAYVNSLLNKYSYIPFSEKEIIYKYYNYYKTYLAYRNNNCLVIKTVDGNDYLVIPYAVICDKFAANSYFVSYDIENNKPFIIPFHQIKDSTIIEKKCYITDEIYRKLEKINSSNVYLINKKTCKVKIKFFGNSIYDFIKNTNNLDYKYYSEDTLELIDIKEKIIKLLIPYGDKIKILNNKDIENELICFYSNAVSNINEKITNSLKRVN